MACEHKSFDAEVSVNRIEDIGRFVADVRIKCMGCGEPMRFLGLPLGLDYNSSTVSFDGCEARIGIHPKSECVPPIHGVEGFTIRKKP